MRNKLLIVLTLISLSTNMLFGNSVFKINTLPDSLVPLFRYNMNVALFKGSEDSVYVVNVDGDIIFRGPKTTTITFNSNLDFDGVNEEGHPLQVRNDLNLDGVYPIVIRDGVDRSTYAIDYNGRIVIEKGKYENISYFVDGYARVSKDDKWGVIDVNAKEIVPLSVSDESHFFINHNIWQYFESDSKWHMIDNHGKDVCSFDEISYNHDPSMRHIVEK
ncbi:MAG: WG repeat-containing protein, partial [Bacteroidales bacterium]|nr:WG repeat-containing protein [Bacteroidales bacterium]